MNTVALDAGSGNAFRTDASPSASKPKKKVRFAGFDTSSDEGARYSRSSDNSESTSSIRDRIAYPFRAIKSQLRRSVLEGGVAGAVAGFSIPVFVGYVTGSIVGGIVKLAKMIAGCNSDARKIGGAIGALTSGLVGLPIAVALAVVGAVAGIVIGTAGSVIKLPVDIYHAATLDKSKLNPWELAAKERQKRDAEIEAKLKKWVDNVLADAQIATDK